MIAFPGETKVRETINMLDLRKDEAIERTFKGVSKNFREIFAELSPGGSAELVMQKRPMVRLHCGCDILEVRCYLMQ